MTVTAAPAVTALLSLSKDAMRKFGTHALTHKQDDMHWIEQAKHAPLYPHRIGSMIERLTNKDSR